MCGNNRSTTTTLRWLNGYCIFEYWTGKLPGSCRMIVPSWMIQPINWVWSDHEQSEESADFCSLSLASWEAVGVAHTARVSTFANRCLKQSTSTSCAHATWMHVLSSASYCSELLSTAGYSVAYLSKFWASACRNLMQRSHTSEVQSVGPSIWSTPSVRWWSVLGDCKPSIVSRQDLVYCATIGTASRHSNDFSWVSSKLMRSLSMSTFSLTFS